MSEIFHVPDPWVLSRFMRAVLRHGRWKTKGLHGHPTTTTLYQKIPLGLICDLNYNNAKQT